MTTPLNKEERIELRVSAKDKSIFKKAQELSGDKTFSSFIIRIVKQQAEEIVAEHNRIIASEKDKQVFFDTVFGDNEPNQNLLAAAKRYKSKSSPLWK